MLSRVMRIIQIIAQIALIFCFSLSGDWVSATFQLPLPGNIIGLILLYLALKSRLIPLVAVERGGTFLLFVMPLFFVPALSGIMDYTAFLRTSGLQIVLIVVVSSLLTLVGSAYIVDRLAHRKEAVTRHE